MCEYEYNIACLRCGSQVDSEIHTLDAGLQKVLLICKIRKLKKQWHCEG